MSLSAPANSQRFRVLAASAVSHSHTGDTAKTSVASLTVPANSMGPNGILRITTLWSATNNANAKTVFTDLGGTSFQQSSVASVAEHSDMILIRNRNSVSSQVCTAATHGAGGIGLSSAAITTGVLNTGTDLTLTFYVQCNGSGSDTLALESYLVEVLYLP